MLQQQVEYSSPSGARKRPCNPESWAQNQKKRVRNLGKEYTQHHLDHIVPARSVGEACSCKLECFTALGDEAIKTIHSEYWALGDFDLRTAFIQKCVTENPVKRHYTNDVTNQRSNARQYHLSVNGK